MLCAYSHHLRRIFLHFPIFERLPCFRLEDNRLTISWSAVEHWTMVTELWSRSQCEWATSCSAHERHWETRKQRPARTTEGTFEDANVLIVLVKWELSYCKIFSLLDVQQLSVGGFWFVLGLSMQRLSSSYKFSLQPLHQIMTHDWCWTEILYFEWTPYGSPRKWHHRPPPSSGLPPSWISPVFVADSQFVFHSLAVRGLRFFVDPTFDMIVSRKHHFQPVPLSPFVECPLWYLLIDRSGGLTSILSVRRTNNR